VRDHAPFNDSVYVLTERGVEDVVRVIANQHKGGSIESIHSLNLLASSEPAWPKILIDRQGPNNDS